MTTNLTTAEFHDPHGCHLVDKTNGADCDCHNIDQHVFTEAIDCSACTGRETT